ncbi:WG repeat-containing protein [Campylobacter sp. CCS1377]|uniref:WG repeat-containing protein n=1 Tax=Campylobacter sp. CCS1377 TaxID=3158229 RepID=A0AAU7E981_9BACT|nr:WG repeat-containing protein [Campylobacter jejuni]
MKKFQILIMLFLVLFLAACRTHTLNYSSKAPIFYEEDNWKVFFDNDRFGFKDQNGSVVIKPQFDLALDFKNGVARVAQDKNMGLLIKVENLF